MNLVEDYERRHLRLSEETSRRRDTAIIERDRDKLRDQRFIITTNDNDSTSITSAATVMLTRQTDIEIHISIVINAISKSEQNTFTTHDSNITSYISSFMSQTMIIFDSRRSDRLRNRQNRTQ